MRHCVIIAVCAIVLLAGCSDPPAPESTRPVAGEVVASPSTASEGVATGTPDPIGDDARAGGSSGAPPTRPVAGDTGRVADSAPSAPVKRPSSASDNPADGRAGPVELPQQVRDTINDARYSEFRRMCAPYLELRAELRPYELALATGTATQEEVAEFYVLEAKADKERRRLLDFMWKSGHTREDHAAMSLIMTQPLQ